MSVPPNLNPDNIPVREMSTAERFMIMFGQPIPRCEWTLEDHHPPYYADTRCGVGFSDSQRFEKHVFCSNCGSRIKFITK